MKLKLTLKSGQVQQQDVMVTTDATATVEDVARALDATQSIPSDAVPTLSVAPPDGKPTELSPTAYVAEAPLGSGFDVRVVKAQGAEARSTQPIVATMTIHNGVEAGRLVPLVRGVSTLGRAAPADVVLNDQSVSKLHARIDVGNRIELVDLNSANGIMVGGGYVQRVQVIPGEIITIGNTEVSFVVFDQSASPEQEVLERGGILPFNRSPRVELRYPGEEFRHPTIPQESEPRMFPWPMIMAPMILGIAMFSLTQRPTSLLIVFMAPMMMLGNFIGQRTSQGKKSRLEIKNFELEIDQLEETLLNEEVRERELRRAEAPSTSKIYEEAISLGPLLWTRRSEHWNFLALRLGSGTAKSRNSIHEAGEQRGIAEYLDQVKELSERFSHISDVPLVELLTSCGALGIAGPLEHTADALRGIAVQLFGLHSPGDLNTAVLIDPAWLPHLEWIKWLPHSTDPQSPFADISLADNQSAGTALLNRLEEVISARQQGTAKPRGPLKEADTSMELGKTVGERFGAEPAAKKYPATLLIVSGNAPVDRGRLVQLIERGPEAGIYTVFVSNGVASLPSSCRTYVDVSQGLDDATVAWIRAGKETRSVQVEGLSATHAEHFAKCLAPVIDAGQVTPDSSDLPASVSLLKLIGFERASDPSAVIDRWQQNKSIYNRNAVSPPRLKRAGALKAVIGQGSPDAMHLDLRANGPHALVGGTTGAGKSEFLQAWVLGLASEYSPDRVTFLFVDYKGGSAFADGVELPHCVGLVTDLSPHLVRRALTSLRAELHHREHLFNRKKVKDLLEMEKKQDPETPPALVLVIDEFAALATEVPEFVDGVVDIAQRGRSLGIHLIMATQRPAGVIKDNLRANTNLRVALRMADASDSNDVLGDTAAAFIDPSLPGRGYVKTGPGRLIPFQSGYAGGWSSAEPERAQVQVSDLGFGACPKWEAPESAQADLPDDAPEQPTDQKRIVTNLVNAALQARVPTPRRPWLDDLAPTYDLLDFLAQSLAAPGDIPFGWSDIPERQLQEVTAFSPDRDGHMLVYGTSGAGKTVVLRTLGVAAGANQQFGATAVYALDMGTGALRSIEVLPHVGAVVSGDDAERVQRLLRTLRTKLDERSKLFSEVNAATISEYWELTGDYSTSRILLLVDGYPTFRNDWENSAARSPFYAVFMRILGEGRPLGIHIVATADRYGAVPTAVSANVTKRIVLRLADSSGYSVLGAPKDVLDESSVPGRAIVDGYETQIAAVGGTANVAQQNTATEKFAQQLLAAGVAQAPGIGALPTEYTADSLPAQQAGKPVLGIGDDTLGPAGFEPVGTFVVAGPPLSGKTNALRSLISAVERFDPAVQLYHFGGRRAALAGAKNWFESAVGPEKARTLAKELTEILKAEDFSNRLMIVVENLTEFADTDAERPLKELFQAINRSESFLVADGDIHQLSSGYGLIGELKAGRQGIALRPETFDGETLFKVPFPKVQRHEFPPGRAIFAQNGRAVTVQLPLLGSES